MTKLPRAGLTPHILAVINHVIWRSRAFPVGLFPTELVEKRSGIDLWSNDLAI